MIEQSAKPRPLSNSATMTDENHHETLSPFSSERVSPDRSRKEKKSPAKLLLILLLLLGIVIVTVAGILAYNYFNDPYRTLEPFPISQYLENPQPLSGLKFRAELRADADLGWKEGVGRLMAFTVEGNSMPVAVFIPPNLSDIYFIKGQTYRAEVEIKEGGLIYAISCDKK